MAQASTTKTKTAQKAKPAKKVSEATAAKLAAANGTKAAGRAIAAAGQRAKTPLIVGGAALAGVAGGLVLNRRSR